MIFRLPDFILVVIQGFLTLRPPMVYTVESEDRFFCDKDFERSVEEDKAWRNLMNTTKLVKDLKRKTIYLVLKDSFALLYMNDELFRQRVDGLVLNRRDQLYISLETSSTAPLIIRNASWDDCNMIKLKGVKSLVDFSTISSVRSLRLSSCVGNVVICNLNDLETLDLISCETIEVICNCPRLTRLGACDCSNLRDISNLTNLISLFVWECPKLTIQEKTLQSVQFLCLGDESKIFPSHNINCFKNLKYLSLEDKDVVEDEIWQLDKLSTLSFLFCKNIKVTKFPSSLMDLKFWQYSNVSHLISFPMPRLQSLQFLEVYVAEQVIDLPQPVKYVRITDCFNLKDIYLYSSVKHLIIDDSKGNYDAARPQKYEDITLWIGRGISTPNLTVEACLEFHLKIMS